MGYMLAALSVALFAITAADLPPDYCQVPDKNYFLPCHDIEPDIAET